jgi:hypothetical protein
MLFIAGIYLLVYVFFLRGLYSKSECALYGPLLQVKVQSRS